MKFVASFQTVLLSRACWRLCQSEGEPHLILILFHAHLSAVLPCRRID